jgi:putative protease
MATRKKAKGKTKAKRKKTPVKAATRRKTTTVRKKPAKKAPVRRASPKKASPTAKAAVKSTPDSPPAQPKAATPMPSLPAQPPPGERIGVVSHYYSHLSVATLRLESGTLRVGDVIHIRGHTTDFSQRVESLEINHSPATEVGPNDDFGLKVMEHAREQDVVYKVRP